MRFFFIFSLWLSFISNSYAKVQCSDDKYVELVMGGVVDMMESVQADDLRPRLYWGYEISDDDEIESVTLLQSNSILKDALSHLSKAKGGEVSWYVLAWVTDSNDKLFYDDPKNQVFIRLNSGLRNSEHGLDSFFEFSDAFKSSFPEPQSLGCGFNLLTAIT